MAILWDHEDGENRYSVRRHGASIRLYRSGVFHSQWNPDRPFAGGVWDCLSLPALYRPGASLVRGAVLGVGGGAVLRQLALLVPGCSLLGIEIDAVHLEVAERWFGVPRERLLQGDAVRWLHEAEPAGLDLIIDDLFGDDAGQPVRAAPLEFEWVDSLVRALSPSGLLVINAITSRELKRAVPVLVDAGLRHGARWTLPGYDNAIGVLSREPLHGREWSRRLDGAELTAAARRQARACDVRPLAGLGLRSVRS